MKNILTLLLMFLFFITALLLLWLAYKYFNKRIMAARSFPAVLLHALLMIIVLFALVSAALYGLIATAVYLGT